MTERTKPYNIKRSAVVFMMPFYSPCAPTLGTFLGLAQATVSYGIVDCVPSARLVWIFLSSSAHPLGILCSSLWVVAVTTPVIRSHRVMRASMQTDISLRAVFALIEMFVLHLWVGIEIVE